MIFYVDGACSGNGSTTATGGFGVVGLVDDIGVYYYSVGSTETTNNREELKAILHVMAKFGADLKNIRYLTDEEVPIVYSDSAYCVNTLNDWMYRWAENDWKKSDGNTPENLDLIKLFYDLRKAGFKIDLRKVRGHSGDYWNELADQMAKSAKEKQVETVINMTIEEAKERLESYGKYNSNSNSR